MVDTGGPWVCEACSAPNADYRRRCQDCGAAKPADPTRAPAEAPAAGAIPMPLLARRPERRLGRTPAVLLTLAVVALAVYGAVSYFSVDPPTEEDDLADLRTAFLDEAIIGPNAVESARVESGAGVRIPVFDSASCADPAAGLALTRAEDEMLYDGGEADVGHVLSRFERFDGTTLTVRMAAFHDPAAAARYHDLLSSDGAEACGLARRPDESLVEGRVWLMVELSGRGEVAAVGLAPTDEEQELMRALADRLELEG